MVEARCRRENRTFSQCLSDSNGSPSREGLLIRPQDLPTETDGRSVENTFSDNPKAPLRFHNWGKTVKRIVPRLSPKDLLSPCDLRPPIYFFFYFFVRNALLRLLAVTHLLAIFLPCRFSVVITQLTARSSLIPSGGKKLLSQDCRRCPECGQVRGWSKWQASLRWFSPYVE